MPSGRLTPLQLRILEVLADFEPALTLTGGGALVGFHLGHRATRDLDLFMHGEAALGEHPTLVIDRLRSAGMQVDSTELGVAMRRLRVSDGAETVVVDLVAEPVATVEAPTRVPLGGKRLSIDTRHEILVNKLCTLIERSEVRDLEDVRELVATGGDLSRALVDAPRKDGGFSPLTLVWLLREFPVRELAAREGWPDERTARVEAFRAQLIGRLTDQTRPER